MFSASDADTLEEEERRCIVRLYFWAVSHQSSSRQGRHLAFHPSYSDCPDADVLELMKGQRFDRPKVAQTDAELDASATPLL